MSVVITVIAGGSGRLLVSFLHNVLAERRIMVGVSMKALIVIARSDERSDQRSNGSVSSCMVVIVVLIMMLIMMLIMVLVMMLVVVFVMMSMVRVSDDGVNACLMSGWLLVDVCLLIDARLVVGVLLVVILSSGF